MDDDWPERDDLPLDASRSIWKFYADDSDPDLVHLLFESQDGLHDELVLPVDGVPQLACFDLEYWDAMMTEVNPDNAVEALRIRMKQKYFQKVRTRITNTLSKGKHDAVLHHSLLVEIAHKWSIRTINRYTHSPFGREQYNKHCEEKWLVPYEQKLTHQDWKKYFLANAKKYTSAANRADVGHSTLVLNDRQWMSAGGLLRHLLLLPPNSPVHLDVPVTIRPRQTAFVSRLPIELLDMIMQFAVDDDWSCCDVLRLAGVCALWKEIAEKCGPLWHKLHISSPGSGNSWGRWASRIRSVALVKRFLSNSHLVPLDITISFTPSLVPFRGKRYSEPPVYALIREVIKHAMRWSTLQLLIDVDCPDNPRDRSDVGCIHQTYSLLWETGALAAAQKLRELIIRRAGTPYPITKHVGYRHPTTTIPSGQTFQLCDLRLDACVGGFPAPMLRHVTRLSVGDTSEIIRFKDLLGVLDDCPVLEDLTVRHLPCRSAPSTPPQMRNLKALRFIDTPHPTQAFEWFSEPNLETIEVLADGCSYRSVLRYQSFIQLTGSLDALRRIRHIDVGGATMTNNELQPLIAACTAAIRISFRANSSDEARTGILRSIRTTISRRRGLAGGKKIHLTLNGWVGVGKTNKMALEEVNKLKTLACSSLEDGRHLWF